MLALLTTGESGESASEARVNQLPLATRSVLGPGFCRWQRGGLRGLPLAKPARRQLTVGAIGGADGSQPSNCPRIAAIRNVSFQLSGLKRGWNRWRRAFSVADGNAMFPVVLPPALVPSAFTASFARMMAKCVKKVVKIFRNFCSFEISG